jgi:DNA-directed RNA polymerase specialized sigma24 family protein
MNFPHATDEQISTARRMLVGFCLRDGMQLADAEDAAQDVIENALRRKYRNRCPATITVAAAWRIRHARKYGGARALLASDSSERRRHAAAVKRGDPMPTRDTAPAYANPATVAEQAEGMSYARRRLAERLDMTPATLALLACGFGPMDDEDTTKVTSTSGIGPGHTPPAKGCPGLSTASDPNPQRTATLRTVAPVALEGDNLAAYRAELARYYRGEQ